MYYKLLIVIFLSSFILLFTNELDATCPDGYTSVNTTFKYANSNGDSCIIKVYFCIIVEPNGNVKMVDDYIELEMPCAQYIIIDSVFWAKVREEMVKKELHAPIYPPCPLQSIIATIKKVSCWQFVNDPSHDKMYLIPCASEGYCECTYKVCTDYSSLIPANVITPLGCNTVGVPGCQAGQPLIPPLGKTIDDEWTTECRNLGCY